MRALQGRGGAGGLRRPPRRRLGSQCASVGATDRRPGDGATAGPVAWPCDPWAGPLTLWGQGASCVLQSI